MLALGAALSLLQGLQGVSGVARRLPQLPQPLGQLDHAGVQHVQTDVQLVQACVQAGQAAHCGRTERTLNGTLGAELGDRRTWGDGELRLLGVELGRTRESWKVGGPGRQGQGLGAPGDVGAMGWRCATESSPGEVRELFIFVKKTAEAWR